MANPSNANTQPKWRIPLPKAIFTIWQLQIYNTVLFHMKIGTKPKAINWNLKKKTFWDVNYNLQKKNYKTQNTKHKIQNTEKINIQNAQFYNGGPLFEMPMSGLMVHTMWNATSASWIFFNREALGWIMMMMIKLCCWWWWQRWLQWICYFNNLLKMVKGCILPCFLWKRI